MVYEQGRQPAPFRIATYGAPATIPVDKDCRCLLIPNDLTVKAAINDVLTYLAQAENWEGENAQGAAWAIADMLQGFYEAVEAMDYPRRATMWHDEAIVVSGGALSHSLTSSQRYNGYVYQVTHGDGDTFTQSFYLAAGTYTIYWLGVSGDGSGIVDWALDGVGFETGQDWYSAALTYNVVKSATLIVPESGIHTLTGTVNGKNAASSNYYVALTKYWAAPASD